MFSTISPSAPPLRYAAVSRTASSINPFPARAAGAVSGSAPTCMTATTGLLVLNRSSITERDLLDIEVAELQRRLAAEDFDAHLEQALRLVDALDLARERRERPRQHAHRIAQPERLRHAPPRGQFSEELFELV